MLTKPYTVVVADDHEIVRAGLIDFLRNRPNLELEIVGRGHSVLSEVLTDLDLGDGQQNQRAQNEVLDLRDLPLL